MSNKEMKQEMKLMPIEPTPAILQAMVKMREGPAVYKVMSDAGLRSLEADAADEYAAALAAAGRDEALRVAGASGPLGDPDVLAAGVESSAGASAWWALVMGAAASIEDAANCLRDQDAKKQADGAAKHYREAAQKMLASNGVGGALKENGNG